MATKLCFKQPCSPPALLNILVSQVHTGHPENHIHDSGAKSDTEIRNKRWLTYNHNSNGSINPNSKRERNQTVSSYYNQTAIHEASRQNSIRLTPATIMYTGKYLYNNKRPGPPGFGTPWTDVGMR